MSDQLARHSGIANEPFSVAIRGQLVSFATGARIESVDQSMKDAIDTAGADVEWDDTSEASEPVDTARRRGRPPKTA